MEKLFLIQTVNESIDDVCFDDPAYAAVKNDNGLAIIWYHDDYTDSLWDMFDSNITRNKYFNFIEHLFYVEFKKKLYVSFKAHPIEFNNKLSTCILLEW